MRKTTPLMLWLAVFLLAVTPTYAQDKPKASAELTMSIGGPTETMIVPVTSGDTKVVSVGDLIEIGLSAKNPYKGKLTWTVTAKPPKLGQNEKNRSCYFGTGKVNTKFHVCAWGVKQSTDDDGKPLPNVNEAYIVAECWVEVTGGGDNPPGPNPPGPNPPTPLSDLEKKILAAWAVDKSTGSLDTVSKVAATFDELTALMSDANFTASPANILKEYTSRVKAKGVAGSTIPQIKNIIGDVMEAVIPAASWNDQNALGFDNKGRVTAAFNNLSKALKLVK